MPKADKTTEEKQTIQFSKFKGKRQRNLRKKNESPQQEEVDEIKRDEISCLLELRDLTKKTRGVIPNVIRKTEVVESNKENKTMEAFTNSTLLMNMEQHMNSYINQRLNQVKDPTVDLHNDKIETGLSGKIEMEDNILNSAKLLTRVEEVDLNSDVKIKKE